MPIELVLEALFAPALEWVRDGEGDSEQFVKLVGRCMDQSGTVANEAMVNVFKDLADRSQRHHHRTGPRRLRAGRWFPRQTDQRLTLIHDTSSLQRAVAQVDVALG